MPPSRRVMGLVVVLFSLAACSDDNSADKPAQSDSTAAATTSTASPTECATTPAPDGRLVSVTVDDVIDGFGSLGLRANSGLTPGVVRIEVIGDADNAALSSVAIVLDGVVVATVDGVGAGETCGIDLEVTEGTFHITEGDRDVEFTVEP